MKNITLKKTFLLFIALIPTLVFGENKATLSDSLWNRATSCQIHFEDLDENEKPPFDMIDDSENGYFKISGAFPTCGCACSLTVGAYINTEGLHTFLQSDSMMCSWERKISSNKQLKEILPTDFGINTFMSETIDAILQKPIFFIDFEVPRIGTDTKAKIELIPFGIFPEGSNLVSYEYREQDSLNEESKQSDKVLTGIHNIAKNITDEKTLTFLLSGDFEKISAHDNEVILAEVSDNYSNFKSLDELQHYLVKLKKAYDLYAQLETDEVILGWDKAKSKFFIKEKGESISIGTFKEFLVSSKYYSPMC